MPGPYNGRRGRIHPARNAMEKRIFPVRQISGAVTLPGDKSISHRYALIASVAEGVTRRSKSGWGGLRRNR